ncbi:MAG: DegT/DnrJ/EryC1/StrS family aminotransferase [Phycisphaeraceae bacterium]|nr:DegT/DnrJ/EryC1/StrS family aminotransferase [Phycisphaerales bacterium]MCB9859120.1 DegT/DnrJ/EryC1/StrS family aminotransferase [Phycisphaeraceae bacterium]
MPNATATDHTISLAINGGSPVSATPVPFMSLGLTQQDIDAANEVLKSGMLRQAKKCAEFEERFGSMSDAKHALTCANGTCALQLAYGAMLEPGDEVIVPAWTYIATASMLAAAGCKLVFCDVREDTFQIDVDDVAKRITPNTKAIACTHLYGMPVDIDGVLTLAKKHNLHVIFDAAQAHLARYNGKGLGAYGDATTFSFYATKNLGTGEGGMVMTNDDGIARKMGMLRSHGETDKYLHESIGFNYRMNDITAAIGCSKLDTLQDQTHDRQKAAKRYDEIIAEIDGLEAPTHTPNAEPSWHLYTVKFDPAKFTCTRDEFIKALAAEGVPNAVHYPKPLTRQPAFAKFVTEHPPVSAKLSERVFCIPMHHALTEDHFRIVREALTKVADAYRA